MYLKTEMITYTLLFLLFKAHGETLDEAMKGMQVGLLIGYEGVEEDAFPHYL